MIFLYFWLPPNVLYIVLLSTNSIRHGLEASEHCLYWTLFPGVHPENYGFWLSGEQEFFQSGTHHGCHKGEVVSMIPRAPITQGP